MQLNFRGISQRSGLRGSIRGGFLALLAGCAMASPSLGAPMRIQARQDQRVESSFALDFGQGGTASAMISQTTFELEIDGINGSAKFTNYDQNIDSLTLPGGLNTGAIRVQIVTDSSTGTYNRATGEFTTDELYSIEFDGDLSAAGLFSPVVLPSHSVGILDLEDMATGRVTMNWAGNTAVPFDISYACSLFAAFSTTAESYVEIKMLPMLLNASMPETLKGTLTTYLDSAINALNGGNVRSAVSALRSFILKLRSSSQGVAQADANALVEAANTAIVIAENRKDQVFIQAPTHSPDATNLGGSPKHETTRGTE